LIFILFVCKIPIAAKLQKKSRNTKLTRLVGGDSPFGEHKAHEDKK
jgi:hypothetical protein